MNNEVVDTPKAPVSANVFGAEIEETPKKKRFSLSDPGFRRGAEREAYFLDGMLFKCCMSRKGNPYFRCPDTANGTVMVCPKNTPADLVGKCGYLTIGILPNTEFEESDEVEGAVMPSKPVTFVDFKS